MARRGPSKSKNVMKANNDAPKAPKVRRGPPKVSTLAEKFAIIWLARDFIAAGHVHVTGSCGLILALCMERALPSAAMFALMAFVLAPGDLDFVFTSKDRDVLEAFLEAIGVKTNWAGEIEYAYIGEHGWKHETDFSKLPPETRERFDKAECLSALGVENLNAILRLTDKMVLLNRLQVGNVEIDVRFADEYKHPTAAEMFNFKNIDTSTLVVAPMTVIVKWIVKAEFTKYYFGVLATEPRGVAEALDSIQTLVLTPNLDDLQGFVDFVHSRKSYLSPWKVIIESMSEIQGIPKAVVRAL